MDASLLSLATLSIVVSPYLWINLPLTSESKPDWNARKLCPSVSEATVLSRWGLSGANLHARVLLFSKSPPCEVFYCRLARFPWASTEPTAASQTHSPLHPLPSAPDFSQPNQIQTLLDRMAALNPDRYFLGIELSILCDG